MRDIDGLLGIAPVIPVLVIDRVEDAVPIATALVSGGLPVIEVTLRTEAALSAIKAIRDVPGAIIGAGTVLTANDVKAAVDAGAEFLVSPGLTDHLARAAADERASFLPGISSASEVMRAIEHGYFRLKFFPAEASGGRSKLNALATVFPTVRFCPTGGITQQSAADWLALPAVACVGGSWLVPRDGAPDQDTISLRAREAAALRPRPRLV